MGGGPGGPEGEVGPSHIEQVFKSQPVHFPHEPAQEQGRTLPAPPVQLQNGPFIDEQGSAPVELPKEPPKELPKPAVVARSVVGVAHSVGVCVSISFAKEEP